jgi:hypothetical protein
MHRDPALAIIRAKAIKDLEIASPIRRDGGGRERRGLPGAEENIHGGRHNT